ncbi:MAG: peptide chain release factor 1 [Saprospiraceae bacterium]|jgi:peptide chain release factor 1|nr:peptide chain release factor 1 [Saprospiraceae bacterium]MDG1433408.1 peptide chain release factor 1 [Saprospiraceae bacterium]MDG2419813.1 peptide chain release factor 1 [Saprospiraceae bacterium]
MLDKLTAIYEKYVYIEEQLGDPSVVSDMDRFTKLNKEYKSLQDIVDVYKKYKSVLENIRSAKEMLADEEMKDMAQEELEELIPNQEELEERIKILLIPKDPEDEKDVIFEIRSGAGGDEASLFAGDLYKMYSRYFSLQGWKVEPITINEGSVGGYNKIVLEINGTDVYGKLKFESGAHRVQRVPKTESQGRVHTSAATVVVMPKFEMEDIDINKADLRRDTFRASGAGGQHVNKTESGVRFTHIPTGIVAESTDGRSQHKNQDIALNRLYAKIHETQKNQHDSKVAAERRSLVGSGDRSDKVRTYNFPQNRVTDHRIGLSLNKLDKVIGGDVEGIIEALQMAENAEKMKAETDK